ncbi:MAG: hypothetical protein H0U65_02085 [Rubrobacter sp.]|nr:hypothetical protein [Rubrobacter sp.]
MEYFGAADAAINCPEESKGTENLDAPHTIAIFRKAIAAAIAVVFVSLAFLLMTESAGAVDATPPANDHIEDAEIIRGNSAILRSDNRLATRERGELDHILSGSSVGQNSVWYRWTAWTSGPMEADVCQSGFDTILAVYTKDEKGNLDQVADNDDGCSTRNERGSSVVFEAELEETYWIVVSGYSKASAGVFHLKLAQASPPDAG